MKKLLALSLLALAATTASADAAWLQFSIYSPGDLLLPWARDDVYGLRLDMPYGNNKGSVVGIDLGLVGVAGEQVTGFELTCLNVADLAATKGLQVGVLANRTKDVYGVQLGGVLNWNEDAACGLQSALVNYDGEFYGLQVGGVNWFIGNAAGVSLGAFLFSNNDFTGLSVAAFNYGVQNMTGAQLGLFNLSLENSTGVQIGLVNASKHHEGVQIGLVNLNEFGFLPCFPFVNFNFTR